MTDQAHPSGQDERTALHARIAQLEQELETLRQEQASTTLSTARAGSVDTPTSSTSLTIAGLEEMHLELKPDDTITYINRPMARLYNITERKSLLGAPLSALTQATDDGVLQALLQLVRTSHTPQLLERTYHDFDTARLATDPQRPAGPITLRFCASTQHEQVHIIVQEVTRLRWLERTFSRYVSPAVISQMQTQASEDYLRMENKELTILFADLRGFTSISQTLAPVQVQEMVNAFLANMVQCVERLEGTVDKFVGDEIIVLFGAPLPQAAHALRGLLCAAQMQQAHQAWMEQRVTRHLPYCPMGVGLATGEVVVGNIGTPSRMNYTVLGHTVNLAARLCGAAQGGQILTTPETHQAALHNAKRYKGDQPIPKFRFHSEGPLSFKNVSSPVEVLRVEPHA